TKDANGQAAGGPMHYITLGMGQKWKPLAIFFAISGVLVALLGMGTFSQVNSIASSMSASFGLAPQLVSIVTAISIAFFIFGGIEKISDV
ncbi:alanine:cation symporter family protein, partial [Streptococcus suis]